MNKYLEKIAGKIPKGILVKNRRDTYNKELIGVKTRRQHEGTVRPYEEYYGSHKGKPLYTKELKYTPKTRLTVGERKKIKAALKRGSKPGLYGEFGSTRNVGKTGKHTRKDDGGYW